MAPIDVANYPLLGNNAQQERGTCSNDPHVVVDRFADHLPQELYHSDFQRTLIAHFPAQVGIGHDAALQKYVNCLAFVEQWLTHGLQEGRGQ